MARSGIDIRTLREPLRAFLREQRMTATAFARENGLDPSTICPIVKGTKTTALPETALAIARQIGSSRQHIAELQRMVEADAASRERRLSARTDQRQLELDARSGGHRPSNVVVIIHADDAVDFAQLVAERLRGIGVRPWVASERDVDLPVEIDDAIRLAGAVVVILSEASVTSVRVAEEIGFAGRDGVPLLVIRRHQDVAPPARIARAQEISFVQPQNRPWPQLIAALECLLPAPTMPEPTAEKRDNLSRASIVRLSERKTEEG